jgi:hypothetical protein
MSDQPLPGMPHKTRSRSARLGYDGERAVEVFLRNRGYGVDRPRAGRHEDIGDLAGLPLVVSVKNHAQPRLAEWCNDLEQMIGHSPWETGVVWHKKRGRSDPGLWYVTMTGYDFVPFLASYCEVRDD